MTVTVTDSSTPPMTARASTTSFVVQRPGAPSGSGGVAGQDDVAIDGLLVKPQGNLPSAVKSGDSVTADYVISGGVGPYAATMDPPIPGLAVTVRQGWGAVTAEFAGTPPAGSYPAGRVTVSDSSVPPLTGSVATPSVSVVAPPAQPLTLAFTPLPSHEPTGAAVESVVSASGGTPPYAISMDAPDPGFALTPGADGSSATLAGTVADGTYAPMTARVVDSSTPPQSATATVNGFVAQDPSIPAIVITPSNVFSTVTTGQPGYEYLLVSGGTYPYAGSATTPADVTFVDYTNYGSAFFYYYPTQPEEIPAFDLTVTDSGGLSTTYTVPKVTAVAPVKTPFSLVAVQDFPNTVQPGDTTQAYVQVVGGTAPFHVAGLSPVDDGFAVPGDPSGGYQPTVDVIGKPSRAGAFDPMTLSVSDATGAVATLRLDGFKVPRPTPITLTAIGTVPTDVALGDRYKASYVVAGGVPPYAITTAGSPAGVAADVVYQTVTLSGRPTQAGGQPGTGVTVTDAFGTVANLSTDPFSVQRYGDADTLVLHGNPAVPLRASLGVALSATYEVFGGTPPYRVTVDHLPAGLALTPEAVDTTGQAPGNIVAWDVSGTPSVAGMKTSSTITAFDSAGHHVAVGTGEMNVVDDGAYSPLQVSGYSHIGATSLDYAADGPSGTATVGMGSDFGGGVYYQGGIEPVTFAVSGGYPGLHEVVEVAHDYNGRTFQTVSLFGTPASPGTVDPIYVTATDAVGRTATYVVHGFAVSADAPGPAVPVVLTATSDIPDVAVGQSVSAAFAATGGTTYYGGKPQAYGYTLTGAPRGLMLSDLQSLDGTISVVGSPLEAGTFAPTVVVSDNYESTASYTMKPFTVAAAQPSAGGLCLLRPFSVGPYATNDGFGSYGSYVTAVVGCGTAPYTVTTAANAPDGVLVGPAGPCPTGIDGTIAAWSTTSDPITVTNLGVTVTDIEGRTVTIPSFTGALDPQSLGYEDGYRTGCGLN
jgi:hypothetical protein